MILRRLVLVGALFLGLGLGARPVRAAAVRGLEFSESGDAVVLRIAVDGEVDVRDFALGDPPRIVVDVEGARLDVAGTRLSGLGPDVKAARYSRFAPEPEPVARIVIDLVRDVAYRIESRDGELLVVIGDEGFTPKRAVAGATKDDLDPLPQAPATNATPPAPAVETAPSSSPAVTPEADEDGLARITYLTLSTVYVSAGSEDGLEPGDELAVVRDGIEVGQVRVHDTSRHRAACGVLTKGVDFEVGDAVAVVDAADGASSEVVLVRRTPDTAASTRGRTHAGEESWMRANGFRGRIGARYLSVQDRSGIGQSFSQPALDARLEGREVGGTGFDVSVDVRTRRTYRSRPDGDSSSEGRSRVYRANAAWSTAEGRFSVTAGRQYTPELAAIGIFDGGAAVLRTRQWDFGLLSGTQPDPSDFGWSDAIREHGVFARMHSATGDEANWNVTLGAVASYADGIVNREYAALQSAFSRGALSIYASQDVDLNRDWKRESEGSTLSFTNTFANVRYELARSTIVTAGYDNRRNVRLYRDHVTPDVEFDDSYREGVWLGLDERLGRRVRLGVRAKRATGGTTEQADSYTFSGSVNWKVRARARSTRFTNALLEGWIHSVALSTRFFGASRVEVGGGKRDETSKMPGGSDDQLRWMNVVVDYALGQAWYMSLSFERSDDGPDANDQVYTTLSHRF